MVSCMSEKKNNHVYTLLSSMKGNAILFIAMICATCICGCITLPSEKEHISTAPLITTTVPAGPTVTVIIKARAFDPPLITISEGTTVTWINEDTMLHRVVHLPGANHVQLFDSGPLPVGESYSYTFAQKGRYNYANPQIGGGRSSLVIVE